MSEPVGSHPPDYPPPRMMMRIKRNSGRLIVAVLTLTAAVAAFQDNVSLAAVTAAAAFVVTLIDLAVN